MICCEVSSFSITHSTLWIISCYCRSTGNFWTVHHIVWVTEATFGRPFIPWKWGGENVCSLTYPNTGAPDCNHSRTVKLIQPTRCNSFTSLLLDVHMWLNVFRASPRPSRGAYNCTRSFWFYHWKEAAGVLLVVVWPDHSQQRSNRFLQTVVPEAPSAVVCSWWWAGRRPKHVEPHINVK